MFFRTQVSAFVGFWLIPAVLGAALGWAMKGYHANILQDLSVASWLGALAFLTVRVFRMRDRWATFGSALALICASVVVLGINEYVPAAVLLGCFTFWAAWKGVSEMFGPRIEA